MCTHEGHALDTVYALTEDAKTLDAGFGADLNELKNNARSAGE